MIRIPTPDVPDTERRYPRSAAEAFGASAQPVDFARPSLIHRLLRAFRAWLIS